MEEINLSELKELVLPYIALIGGAWTIVGSILNWNIFFDNGLAGAIAKSIGRTPARMIYITFGTLMIVLALYLKPEWYEFLSNLKWE